MNDSTLISDSLFAIKKSFSVELNRFDQYSLMINGRKTDFLQKNSFLILFYFSSNKTDFRVRIPQKPEFFSGFSFAIA